MKTLYISISFFKRYYPETETKRAFDEDKKKKKKKKWGGENKCEREQASTSRGQEQREKDSLAGSTLSTELDGGSIPRPWDRDLKSRVGCSTDWATQAP